MTRVRNSEKVKRRPVAESMKAAAVESGHCWRESA